MTTNEQTEKTRSFRQATKEEKKKQRAIRKTHKKEKKQKVRFTDRVDWDSWVYW